MKQSNFSWVDWVSCDDCIFDVSKKCHLNPPAAIWLVAKDSWIRGELVKDRRAEVLPEEFCAHWINKKTRQQFIEIILQKPAS